MRIVIVQLCLLGLLIGPAIRAESDVVAQLAQGTSQFALDLYGQVVNPEENLFFSPYSISVALAMTYGGARGDTEAQMQATLRFPFGQETLHVAFQQLNESLQAAQSDGLEWLTANSIWPSEQHPFNEEFLDLVRRIYQSEVFPVDYADADAVRLRINSWVEQKTREKIKSLIPPGALSALTRMVLVNAVYFKAKWSEPFAKGATRPRPFYLADGATNEVQTMWAKLDARIGTLSNGQVLSLPYEGDRVSLVIILPNPETSLVAFEQSLSPELLSEALAALRPTEVEVYLPRFSMTSQFSLGAVLKKMGMTDAFDDAKADFSGMDGMVRNLYISEVVHKAFVEVNEEGTEAAAATGVIMATRAMMPQPTPVFRADRPFFFMIRDDVTGVILFMGRLTQPDPA